MSRRQSIDRRRFLINSSWVGAMGGLLSTRAFAQGRGAAQGQGVSLAQGAPAPDVAVRVSSVADTPVRHFVMTQSYLRSASHVSPAPMHLWEHITENMLPYQVLRGAQWSGDYQSAANASEPEFGAESLFVQWDDCQGPMHLTVEMEIDTKDYLLGRNQILAQYKMPDKLVYPAELQRFLAGSRHIKIDGIVRDKALEIIGDQTNPLVQARLIHDWVAANMERDNSVSGCGVGDVGDILQSGKLYGKCTDINSEFVALARAVGIQAREMFRIRLRRPQQLKQYSKTALGMADHQGQAQNTDWQHCRAQFWLHDIGWVPCDPADVTKMRLAENKKHDDPAVQAVNEDLFGNWEMNWVGFNCGRDFVLAPTPEQKPLNNYGYPYAEAGGDPLNYYDFANFSYDYTVVETT